MPTIVNFGMPQSGTNYIAVAFETIGIKFALLKARINRGGNI